MYKVTIINDGIETVIHHPAFGQPKLQSGQIKQEVNKADGFRFTILPNNPGYNRIHPLKTLIKVLNLKTGELEFDGRVLSPTENMAKSGAFAKSYHCEDELGYLNDSAQRHGEYHDISVRDFLQVIIDNHNRDVADDDIDKTFVVGEVTVTDPNDSLYRYLGYESTLDTIFDKLIDRLGGELQVRKENGVRYLDYLQNPGELKETEIRLSKNLKSITKEVDPSEVITRLIPLGTRIESDNPDDTDASQARLTIESVNNGKDYIVDEDTENALGTIVVKSHVWDDITVPSILKTRGEQFLINNNRMKVKYTIDALDLFLLEKDPDQFEVGNYHRVINPVMNIDENLRIVGKTVDILYPNQNSLIVGDLFKTASQYQFEANKSAFKVFELEGVVNTQSYRIRGLLEQVNNVNNEVNNVKQIIDSSDLEELPEAINSLEQAIQDLNDAIDAIPIYDKATPTQDGLMSKEDKTKLDLLTVTVATNLDALRQKLNLITVTQAINLDDLEARVTALENGP